MNFNKRNETHFFVKIYLSFYSRKGTQFVVSLRDRWSDIYSERGLLLAPSSWSQWGPTLASLARRIVRDETNATYQLCISCSTLFWLDWLSKSDCAVFISRCPLSGYKPARPADPDSLPSRCLLITTWLLVKAHALTRKEPKIHVNSHYITFLSITFFKKSPYGHFLYVSLHFPSTPHTKQTKKYWTNSKISTILK